MRHANRKATKEEIVHLRRIVEDAFPGCIAVIGGHSQFGGHRAPRVRTIALRIKNAKGKFISNVIWLNPNEIITLNDTKINNLVNKSNSN